jgi:hypothetical protein
MVKKMCGLLWAAWIFLLRVPFIDSSPMAPLPHPYDGAGTCDAGLMRQHLGQGAHTGTQQGVDGG